MNKIIVTLVRKGRISHNVTDTTLLYQGDDMVCRVGLQQQPENKLQRSTTFSHKKHDTFEPIIVGPDYIRVFLLFLLAHWISTVEHVKDKTWH